MSGEIPYEIQCEIRFLNRDEWEEAMGLAWRTFLEFEGDVYPPEGSEASKTLLQILL